MYRDSKGGGDWKKLSRDTEWNLEKVWNLLFGLSIFDDRVSLMIEKVIWKYTFALVRWKIDDAKFGTLKKEFRIRWLIVGDEDLFDTIRNFRLSIWNLEKIYFFLQDFIVFFLNGIFIESVDRIERVLQRETWDSLESILIIRRKLTRAVSHNWNRT